MVRERLSLVSNFVVRPMPSTADAILCHPKGSDGVLAVMKPPGDEIAAGDDVPTYVFAMGSGNSFSSPALSSFRHLLRSGP
jgi:hypothetical protein